MVANNYEGARVSRLGRILACSALLAVLLTACGVPPAISARVANGAIEFSVCEPFEFDLVEVVSSAKGERPASAEVMWAAQGEGRVDGIRKVLYGEPMTGAVSTVGPESLDVQGHQIQLYLTATDDSGAIQEQLAAGFDGDMLSEDSWLSASGQMNAGPCGP